METGLGGRWDATSAAARPVSVMHDRRIRSPGGLGKTLGSIAAEKAGILRKGIPLVTGRLRPAARAVVLRRARWLRCDTWELGRTFDWREGRDGTIAVALPGLDLDRLRVGRIGGFQRDNAAIALAASWLLASGEGIGPPPSPRRRKGASWAPDGPAGGARSRSVRTPGRGSTGDTTREAAAALAREISGAPPWGGGRG